MPPECGVLSKGYKLVGGSVSAEQRSEFLLAQLSLVMLWKPLPGETLSLVSLWPPSQTNWGS